jgi:hypothetical protein
MVVVPAIESHYGPGESETCRQIQFR